MSIAKSITFGLLAIGMTLSIGGLAASICKSSIVETTPTADFTVHGNGTVTHNKPGLVWMRCSLGQTWSEDLKTCAGDPIRRSWQQALQVVPDINSGTSNADNDNAAGFAGQTDWRLPNRNELESIVERRCYAPAINATIFPGVPVTDLSIWFWSSSPHSAYPERAWAVDFYRGEIADPLSSKNQINRVRLVRAGQ